MDRAGSTIGYRRLMLVPLLCLFVTISTPQTLLSQEKGQNSTWVRYPKGPVQVYGKFWDGKGEEELRQYDGKKIYVVTAKGTGIGTLVIVKVGAQTLADTSSKRLEANAGPRYSPMFGNDART